MPTDLTEAAARLGFAAEILGTGAAEPIDRSPKEKIKPGQPDVCCDPILNPERSRVTKKLAVQSEMPKKVGTESKEKKGERL